MMDFQEKTMHILIIEQYHIKSQQDGFPEEDKTTHILVAEQCHRRVSRVDFHKKAKQHTL